jgi:hypothetical protein
VCGNCCCGGGGGGGEKVGSLAFGHQCTTLNGAVVVFRMLQVDSSPASEKKKSCALIGTVCGGYARVIVVIDADGGEGGIWSGVLS